MRQTTTQLQATGYTLTVSEALLAGQILTATDGCTVQLNGAPLILPHTLRVGEALTVTHNAGAGVLSGLTLLSATASEALPGEAPDPDAGSWSWVDMFGRSFLGADYDVELQGFAPSVIIANGQLVVGSRITLTLTAGQNESQREFARVRLHADRWNSRAASIQYDAGYTYVQGGAAPVLPLLGVRIIGANKTLEWNGAALKWGAVTLANSGVGMAAEVTYRTRLTVDETIGRIQILRDGNGLVDVPLPADWAAAMGAQGLVELLHESAFGVTNGVGGGVYTRATFDNLAIRAGDGSSPTGTGSAGAGGPRVGALWRFGEGEPDDTIGADGDIYVDTTSGALAQRRAGAYEAAANIRGPRGLPGIPGAPGAARTTRLGTVAAVFDPVVLPAYGQGTRQFSDNPYPVRVRLDFTTAHPIGVEGFRFVVDDLSGGTLDTAFVTDQQGNGVDLGTLTASTTQTGAEGQWSAGRNIAAGTYALTLTFTPGTTLTVQRAQNVYAGAARLVGISTGSGTEIPLGARLSFVQSPPSAAGSLDPFAMRLAPAPSDPANDPQSWGDGAFEIVAAPGSVPYLRLQHEGVVYRVDMIAQAPAGGGGET